MIRKKKVVYVKQPCQQSSRTRTQIIIGKFQNCMNLIKLRFGLDGILRMCRVQNTFFLFSATAKCVSS